MLEASRAIPLIRELIAIAEAYPEIGDDVILVIRKAVGADQVGADEPPEPTFREMMTLRTHGKIRAIKQHRERTGLDLLASKTLIEDAGLRLGILRWASGSCVVSE